MKQFAILVSRLFEPTLVLAVNAVLAGIAAGLQTDTFVWYLGLLIFVMFLPVMLFRVWLVKTKRVSDWDMRKRSQRIKPLLALIGFTSINLLFVWWFGNFFLTRIFAVFLVWIVGFALITMRWKVSGHTGAVALVSGFIISWFGWALWPILFTIPLVGWSRIITKNHSPSEVIGGFLYSLFIIFVFNNRTI